MSLGQESWQGREYGPGEFSYLSGLARRQVKKQRRLKARVRKRRLRTAVRTMLRVGDTRAILGQRGPHRAPCKHPGRLALDALCNALGQWL